MFEDIAVTLRGDILGIVTFHKSSCGGSFLSADDPMYSLLDSLLAKLPYWLGISPLYLINSTILTTLFYYFHLLFYYFHYIILLF